jgi:hypothetical protein
MLFVLFSEENEGCNEAEKEGNPMEMNYSDGWDD